MGLSVHDKQTIAAISVQHPVEFGKVMQKLLALGFEKMGWGLHEEHAVQGVDIDLIDMETGVKRSFEVKTAQKNDITIAAKDAGGMAKRAHDSYTTYYAAYCHPFCITEGWMILAAAGIRPGKFNAMRLAYMADPEISAQVNTVFTQVLKETADVLLDAKTGNGLAVLKEKFGI